MALLLEHTCEASTDEADVVQGQTGHGDAWTSIARNGAITIKYDSARFMHGSRSMRFTRGATSDNGYAGFTLSTAIARMQTRCYVYLDGTPATAQDNLLAFRSAGGFLGYIGWRSDGKMQAYNTSNTGIAASVASATFPINQWVRVEAAVAPGTDTTTGTLEYAYYLGDSTTVVSRWSTAGTTAVAGVWANSNTGIEDPNQVRYGLNGATILPANMWLDTPGVGDGAGFLGPSGATPPVAAVTNNLRQVIDARGSTGTGALSYDISPLTALVELEPGLWAVTPSTTVTLNYTVTVTEGGLTDTEPVSVPPLSGSTTGVRRYWKTGGTFI